MAAKKKVLSSETFDIIKHGPALKEKSSDSSFLSSPTREPDLKN